MDDLISRQAAIDALNRLDVSDGVGISSIACDLQEEAIRSIKSLPSAPPETAVRIVGKSRDGMTLWYQCDMCYEPVDLQDNFCSGCGRMLTDG